MVSLLFCRAVAGGHLRRHCQSKANRYPKVVIHPPSGRKLAPLSQGSGAVLLEDIAAVEVAILVEVVVD